MTIGSFTPDYGPTRPDIAADDERYVVVWRSTAFGLSHDIVGASIDRSGKVTTFSVATSSADERDPSIVAVGDGVFLVAYETFGNDVRQIAGRSVTFGVHHQRVVR